MMWLRFGYIAHRFDILESMLDEIDAKLDRLLQGGKQIMATVEELNATVDRLEVAADAAVKAIGSGGIKPSDLDPAVARIEAVSQKLNDAVHAAGM